MSVADRAVVTPQPAAVRRGLPPWVAFGICAGLLASLAAAVFVMSHLVGGYLDKDPVALHKPLSQLDKSKLAPYHVLDAIILTDEIVEVLETKEYIQWVLEDPRRPAGDPLRYPVLFVTYYTGGRTQVPHTPDRCHLGAGWHDNGATNIYFEIQGLYGKPQPAETRVLQFQKAGLIDQQKRVVAYTFYANCTLTSSRDKIRAMLVSPWVKKAFFSKIEVAYAGSETGFSNPDPKKAEEAAGELLKTVLPVLMQDHWPRYEELLSSAASQPS